MELGRDDAPGAAGRRSARWSPTTPASCRATLRRRRRRCQWSVLVDATVENRGDARSRPRARRAPDRPRRRRGRQRARHGAARWRPASAPACASTSRSPATRSCGRPAIRRSTARRWTRIAAGGVQQRDSARIGLRTVTVRDGLLELNGKPVELRGASIQEDVDGHGPALTDADVERDRRPAQGRRRQRHPRALRARRAAADASSTRPGSWSGPRRRSTTATSCWTTEGQRDAALSTVRAAVLATRNHPSTITHSVANELSVIPDQVPGTAAFLRDARALTRRPRPDAADLGRHAQLPGLPAPEAYAAFDLLGINSYFGWYPGKPGHSTADIRSLGPYLKRHARDVPQRGAGADRVRRRGRR